MSSPKQQLTGTESKLSLGGQLSYSQRYLACKYLSIYLSIYLSLYLSVYLSVCLSVCLSVYLKDTNTNLPCFFSVNKDLEQRQSISKLEVYCLQQLGRRPTHLSRRVSSVEQLTMACGLMDSPMDSKYQSSISVLLSNPQWNTRWAFERKLDIFTCDNDMSSSHVKISPLLWLHNKSRLSHQKTTKVKWFGISLVFI